MAEAPKQHKFNRLPETTIKTLEQLNTIKLQLDTRRLPKSVLLFQKLQGNRIPYERLSQQLQRNHCAAHDEPWHVRLTQTGIDSDVSTTQSQREYLFLALHFCNPNGHEMNRWRCLPLCLTTNSRNPSKKAMDYGRNISRCYMCSLHEFTRKVKIWVSGVIAEGHFDNAVGLSSEEQIYAFRDLLNWPQRLEPKPHTGFQWLMWLLHPLGDGFAFDFICDLETRNDPDEYLRIREAMTEYLTNFVAYFACFAWIQVLARKVFVESWSEVWEDAHIFAKEWNVNTGDWLVPMHISPEQKKDVETILRNLKRVEPGHTGL